MIEITMPRLSDTMEEGAIATWRKKPGDRVEVGDILVEIETDKATMEYEAYEAGTFATVLVGEGENVAIGTPIALIDDGKNEPTSSTGGDGTDASVASTVSEKPARPESIDSVERRPEAGGGDRNGERQFVSPLVRKIARESHLDISAVHGSGPGGRVVRKDIDGLLERAEPAAAAARQVASPEVLAARTSDGATTIDRRGSEPVPMSSTRRVIARRLGQSAQSIPHFYVTAVADAEALMALRSSLNAQLTAAARPKVSVNDLIVRASALALREQPLVNASYVDDQSTTMLIHHRINIGIAVASENGLVVPVVDDADQKTVTQLGTETKHLVELANTKKLSPEQMTGGTFTISNLGMFGVEQFTAIINPPEGAILAVGGIAKEPTVVGDEVLPRYRMRYTLSADHRIIDGALAAQFLQTLTRFIENPWTIVA